MKTSKLNIVAILLVAITMLTGCLGEGRNYMSSPGIGTVLNIGGKKVFALDNPGWFLTGFDTTKYNVGQRAVVYYNIDFDNQPKQESNYYSAEFTQFDSFITSQVMSWNDQVAAVNDTLAYFNRSLSIVYFKEASPDLLTLYVLVPMDPKNQNFSLNMLRVNPLMPNNAVSDTLQLFLNNNGYKGTEKVGVYQSFALPYYGDKKVNLVIKYNSDKKLTSERDSTITIEYQRPKFQ